MMQALQRGLTLTLRHTLCYSGGEKSALRNTLTSMNYSIQELATLAGVSVRALHHYDRIGLLVPKRNGANGYRVYGETELLRLQQILFFRELEFSLEEIGKILANPGFDMAAALAEHRSMILLKRKRLDALVKTIDKTIKKIMKETNMKDEELYDAFSNEEMKELAAEAKERWGNTEAYKQSQEKMRTMTKERMKEIQEEGDAIFRKAATLVGTDAGSDEMQEIVRQHYAYLSNFYAPNAAMYKGMAEMFASDPRFRKHFESYHPELPEFMRDAMIVFAERIGR